MTVETPEVKVEVPEVKVETPVVESPVVETKVETPEVKVETPEVKTEEKKTEEPKEDWRDRRIAQLTARLKTQEPAPRVEAPAPGADETMVPKSEVARLAQEEAQRIAGIAAFNSQCNAAAKEGRKVFPDFDASVKELVKLVDKTDPASRQRYDQFLEAALETGEAHKIIYAMGRDLNEAARIMDLSPIKRAAELAQMASSETPAGVPLPKPITPVQGKNAGPGEISPDNPTRADHLSSAEWHKRRQEQIDANAPSYGRRQQGSR